MAAAVTAAAVVGRLRSRRPATLLASAGLVVLVAGMTYFAILVLTVRFGGEAERAAAFRELGQFLSGQLPWYQDARVYGAVSLLLALLAILLGSHSLARITLVVAGGLELLVLLAPEQISVTLLQWMNVGP